MADNTLFADGLVLPLPTLLAGDSGSPALAAPPPTLVTGTSGAVLAPATAPTLVSNDGNLARLSAPPPTLISSWDYQTALTAPPPTLVAFANDGCQISAPPPTLSAYTGHDAENTAPAPTIDIEVISGAVITFDWAAPTPLLDAVVINPAIITVDGLLAPLPLLVASEISGTVSTALLVAPAPTLASAGYSGTTISALLTAATPILSAAGYSGYVLTFAGQAPAPQLNALLTSPLQATYQTWVFNTRKDVLTAYGPEFAFNSYALFNGQVLACGAGGVVALGTQADDDGTKIDARFRTGKNDYDRSQLKRVPRAYLTYKTDGDIIYRTITNETGTRSYLLPNNFVVGFQQRRVPIGKGPKSMLWQHEVENVNGSDFAVKSALIYPIVLRRRIM